MAFATGAQSRIRHAESAGAEIEFFNEKEFINEVVKPYFDALALSPIPCSVAEFQRYDLNAETKEKPTSRTLWEKLSEIQKSLPHYSNLLNEPAIRMDSLDHVIDYVCQDDNRKKWLAVKSATIYTPFPRSDVHGLGLIDLPGLGEVAKGHAEKLVRSLENEVDAVILVRRPKEGGEVWDEIDIGILDTIAAAMPKIPLAELVFVVLNRTATNHRSIEVLSDSYSSMLRRDHLLVANCTDQSEVDAIVLSEVLRSLESNLSDIDGRYIRFLSEEFTGIVHALSKVFGPDLENARRSDAHLSRAGGVRRVLFFKLN